MAKAGNNEHKSSYTWIVVLVVVILVFVGILMAMKGRKAGKTGEFYGGKEFSHVMLPAGRGPHTHGVDLDETGSGISSFDQGHHHAVEKTIDIGLEQDGDVVPANHQHDITAYIVDADV